MKTKLFIYAAAFLLGSGFYGHLMAQTCSCAGNTFFSPLELTAPSEKHWHLELSYRFHAINDLVEGTEKVVDDTERSRNVMTLMFEIGYNLSPRLTVKADLNVVRHQRQVGISDAGKVDTNGMGDSLFSLQYKPMIYSGRSDMELSIGGGVKVPIGKSDAVLTGIAAEDMQPGTGSWDVLAWGLLSRRIRSVEGLEIFGGASYRFNGTNDREYRFGNEFIGALGARYTGKKLLSYSLHSRYRWADNDRRFGSDVPNTGGEWIYVVPAVTFNIAGHTGVKTQVDIPVYRNLNGVRQFTSTLLVSLSLFYQF
jgi:hypothetical protein